VAAANACTRPAIWSRGGIVAPAAVINEFTPDTVPSRGVSAKEPDHQRAC
jgi:hypothetical protein